MKSQISMKKLFFEKAFLAHLLSILWPKNVALARQHNKNFVQDLVVPYVSQSLQKTAFFDVISASKRQWFCHELDMLKYKFQNPSRSLLVLADHMTKKGKQVKKPAVNLVPALPQLAMIKTRSNLWTGDIRRRSTNTINWKETDKLTESPFRTSLWNCPSFRILNTCPVFVGTGNFGNDVAFWAK